MKLIRPAVLTSVGFLLAIITGCLYAVGYGLAAAVCGVACVATLARASR